MESTVLYLKKYAIYSLLFLLFFECMMFLPCLGYQNKQDGKQILNDETISIYSNEEVSKITFIMELLYFRFSTTSYFCIIIVSSYIVLKKYINDK